MKDQQGILNRWLLNAACIAALLLASCDRAPPPAPTGVTDTVERGPIRLTVEATPREAWLGDPIHVSLTVVAPEEYDVGFPGADAFGNLDAVAADPRDPRPAAQAGREWRQDYTVRTRLSGVVAIPPLAVRYVRKPDPAATKPSEPSYPAELVSGTLEVPVRSALTTQDSIANPRDITGTLAPERHTPAWVWFAGAGGVIATVLGAYLVYRALRRRRERAEPPVPPVVWALRELAALDRPEWLDDPQLQPFYYRLSEIVRIYIEKQFGLAAPEMTTEEFLVMLARDRARLPYDQQRLREFMEACDIVKYAAFQPRREDAQHALGAARSFVDATAAAVGAATRDAARAEQLRREQAA
jgi:hypothetical protein